jgi:deaminated glutathione amidase
VTVDLDDQTSVGLSICYDLRFPDMYSALCSQPVAMDSAGVAKPVEIVLIPAAFTVPTGQAHWEVLLRARAIENQVFVVAAAQSGRHNAKRESYGHSIIIAPWGQILAECREPGEGVCSATLDLDEIQRTRQSMPVVVSIRVPLHRGFFPVVGMVVL